MEQKKQFVVLTSGPIAAGKSSVVENLVDEHEFHKISSGTFLKKLAEESVDPPNRLELVRLGDELDVATDYAWVVSEVAVPALRAEPTADKWIFDSVRKRKQVEHFRSQFPDSVFHVHFYASEQILRERFYGRNKQSDIKMIYDEAIDTPNEREARSLFDLADLVIDTGQTDAKASARRVDEGLSKWSLSF